MAARRDMDDALETLTARSERLRLEGLRDPARIVGLLDRCIASVRTHAPDWVIPSCAAKSIPHDRPIAGEEWLAGPVVAIRNLRLLRETLAHYARTGRFRPGAGVLTVDGHAAARTFPTSRYDAMLFGGFTAATRLRRASGTDVAAAIEDSYRMRRASPGVSLVLGAGNVSSIPPMDALYKIFAHGTPCIVKMNPVNEYLTIPFDKAFAPLIEDGLLRFVRGGAEEGAYLAQHPRVTDVHITGSSATHDAIVWGTGPRQQGNKLIGEPVLRKPITSELGNISPVVIVPGEYTEQELASMAWNVTTQVVNNGSFNCNAAKMLVLAKDWPQRQRFMDLFSASLGSTPPRLAYYPGARERHRRLTAFGVSETFFPSDGRIPDGHLPWTIVHAVQPGDPSAPRASDILFREEPFCAMVTVTLLDAADTKGFLTAATSFCNDTLWGTLNACIMVDPRTERSERDALDAAVSALRYGTIGINHWPALGYGFVSPPWGGHPSSTLADIRSGLGWVHNTYLLPDDLIEKTVIRGPLVVRPKPAWYANNRMAHVIGRRLVAFEAVPSPLKLPGIIAAALRG